MTEAGDENGREALSLFQQGRWQEAADLWHEIIRLDPGDVEAHTGLGAALSELGQQEAAIAVSRTALSLAPNDAAIHSGLVFRKRIAAGARKPRPSGRGGSALRTKRELAWRG